MFLRVLVELVANFKLMEIKMVSCSNLLQLVS